MNRTLLSTESPTYLRRLVRELNAAGTLNGFYTSSSEGPDNIRCNRAKLADGVLFVREIGEDSWFAPTELSFSDAYGRSIVASRHV